MVLDCKYSTATACNLQKHARSHTGEKPYKCSESGCDYSSTQAGDMKKHIMYIHTGEKPHKCEVDGCGYESAQRGHVRSHMKSKHGLDLPRLKGIRQTIIDKKKEMDETKK